MGFKMQTGLLLVIGTIVAGIGWRGIYTDAGGDPAGGGNAICVTDAKMVRAQSGRSDSRYDICQLHEHGEFSS